ncbi:MAG: DUF1640 domain-containing protein [Firmicutes bacterium]|nr:DUF1640 domain-containing protein [Bacillota bacterium]
MAPLSGLKEQAASHETSDEGEGERQGVDWQEKYLDKLDRDMSEMRDSLRHMAEHVEQVVDSLRGEIASLRSEVKSEINAFRSDVNNEINAFRSEVKTEISALKSELKGEVGDLHREVRGINKWVIGLVISAIAGITVITVSAVALVAAAMKG